MATFAEIFKTRGNISFEGIRNTAKELLPKDNNTRGRLYNDLKRGKEILDDDDHLNMYLYSFGNMHRAKLEVAFSTLPNIAHVFSDGVEVYDWGCGQGIASVCLLDCLRRGNIQADIGRICLIEPSNAAIARAEELIMCFDEEIEVVKVTKDFDSLEAKDFRPHSGKKVHLFSNILDVEGFDLASFIHLFQRLFVGENYFVCVGPYYSNDKRVDDFVVATAPDEVYATFTKDKGEWKVGKDWTISMRVFYKHFDCIETIQNIRKRIEDSHKKDQFFAGYILDSVAEEYGNAEFGQYAESLYNGLSVFDVKSNIPLGLEKTPDSRFAVLANIISRGLPTKAPVLLEDTFAKLFHTSNAPKEGAILNFASSHTMSATQIFEALHVIDPRFNSEYYNGDILESQFERNFIERYLNNSEHSYLIQVLEPQRALSSIVDVPNRKVAKDQRVDFALEIPYGDSKVGFVVEMDGSPYHTNIFQRLNDRRRDQESLERGWETYRLDDLENVSFLKNWEQDLEISNYLTILKANSRKKITGTWRDTLEIVLSPLAIARIERVLVEAIMAGALDIYAEKWNIVVVERDVPCAALAIEDLRDKINHIFELAGDTARMPEVNLDIVSTCEFKDSPLHLGEKAKLQFSDVHYDLCIDISMLLRDNVDALPLKVDSDAIYLVRSAHYQKKARAICTAENIQYPPLVTKDTAGSYVSIEERERVLTYFLRDIFRKPSFRPGQLPILSHTLSDKTTIGLLPTGGGKSLTYQLSCMLQPGVAIVVDPLVSLMVDQVRGLRDIRIDACDCVNSGMDAKEKASKLNMLQNGNVLFMLLSPERFMMENFRSSLLTMTERNHIYFSYGIIDEVHCVSEWGHDFRPSYLHLGRNMINFMRTKSERPLSIIGLTATASFDVLADVERELTLGGNLTIDSETIVRPESDSRPELTYRIVEVNSDFDSLREPNIPYVLRVSDERELKDAVAKSKKEVMYALLHQIPNDIEVLNQHDREEQSSTGVAHIKDYNPSHFFEPDASNHYQNAGIIFCPHAHGTFGVEDNQWGSRVGISSELRKRCQDLAIGKFVGGDHPSGDMRSFNENEQNIMVATKAFGMGIDKPNVRYTIHITPSSSIEGYVQEAGRGGRDKQHAISYVLFDPSEYIHLTIDKINDIRYLMGQENDPIWLEWYHQKFILAADLPELCRYNGATKEQITRMMNIVHQQNFLESVDKDINLWFHNNSFRGLYKEEVVLSELINNILNVKATYATEVQGKLRDMTGIEDVCLRVNPNKGSITIVSQDNPSLQYGYLFLDSLRPSYNYVNFDRSICVRVTNSLIEILQSYSDHSALALLRPLEGEDNVTEGIYQAMENATEDGYVTVIVSWENSIKQDPETFERDVRQAITSIASVKEWNDIDEEQNGGLNLSKIEDFQDLLSKISKCSGDGRWLRYHGDAALFRPLERIFCKKRDKDDTDKAIYRMCCIGLVDDVTIDYLSQTYELRIKKRSDEEYKRYMTDFFRKYYSLEQAQKKVAEIDNIDAQRYLGKCLVYLTRFVYENLEKKRYRAIEDMRIACKGSIMERQKSGTDEWLKEFIHLYFNSKYARVGYQVNGESYSLMEDTDKEGRDDFDVVVKYMNVVNPAFSNYDNSGSEIDNIKHLYGATLLCLRAHPDNAALQLLLTFCIAALKTGGNDTLKNNAYNNYIDGMMYYAEHGNVWDIIDVFNSRLKDEDAFVKDKIINNGKQHVMLLVHEKRLQGIANKYLK